jgi:transposase InsO family protein
LELEVIALRHQLGVLRRKQKRVLHVSLADRILWSWLFWMWPQVLNTMVLVRPDTVVGWHRKGFRLYWTWRAQDKRHCPVLTPELRELIRKMKFDNPLWGIRRIQGELRKLGFIISTTSVQKCMPKRYKPPSPGWRMFLREHMRHTVAMDMFVVFTLTYKILYGMILVHHKRRKIVHFAVTANPSQDWLSERLVAACRSNAIPRYLLRTRDALYGKRFRDSVRELGIQEIVAARQSPWQDVYVERVIGSIRSECLNHVVVMNEHHLRYILASYVQY